MQTTPRASRPNMPGYGIVPENEGEGLLPWSWARERLAAAHQYFLATTRPDGGPHVMVVWGLWLDDTFQFSTGKASRKAKNLAAEPRCVVCPEGAEEAVIVEGVAAELAGEAARARFFEAYEEKYGMDVSDMGEPLYVVRPRTVFGQIEKTFTKSATRWQFGS
jgi:nitroimidazol reductase NimA-like FMN-containing flavoprotein (pyridoxamine 5'-phosphate oxidase superfamily)